MSTQFSTDCYLYQIAYSTAEKNIETTKSIPYRYRPRVVDDFCEPTVPFADILLKFMELCNIRSAKAMCTAWLPNFILWFRTDYTAHNSQLHALL